MIRLATKDDLEEILQVYAIAKKFMCDNNNPTQWSGGYPSKSLLQEDIANSNLYVVTKNNEIHGVFFFLVAIDETYNTIYNGQWKNNDLYGAIHKVGSDGKVKGIFSECFSYCKNIVNNIRIDTHKDNKIMQSLLLKNGFEECGIIYVPDGTPRIAYQYCE